MALRLWRHYRSTTELRHCHSSRGHFTVNKNSDFNRLHERNPPNDNNYMVWPMICQKDASTTKVFEDTNGLETVPDKCLLEVLAKLDVRTLCVLRLVNRRLNTIIQRHHELLNKRLLKGINLRFMNGDLVSRVKYFNPSMTNPHLSDCLRSTTLKLCQMDSALRHIRVSEYVCIEGGLVGHMLPNAVRRSIREPVECLDLVDCTLQLGFEEFTNFVRRLGVQCLTLINCTTNDVHIVGDPLFQINKQLTSINLHFQHVQHCPSLTDRTMHEWANDMSWPQTILMHNVRSNFTIAGITAMIKSYLHWCYLRRRVGCLRHSVSVLWNFGTIDGDMRTLYNVIRCWRSKTTIIEATQQYLAAVIRDSPNAPAVHIRVFFTH